MRKTIAQKKALEASVIKSQMEKNGQDWRPAGSGKKAHPFLGLGACVPFAAVGYVCKFMIRGYSFTALVCLGIIGVILFYTLMPLVGRVFPQFARVTTIVFTVLLLCGLALFSFTEYHIIQASFGTPEAEAEYLVVLLVAALVLFIAFYPLESGLPVARWYANLLRWFKWYNF